MIVALDTRRCAFAHCASNTFFVHTGMYITPKRMSELIGSEMDDEVSERYYDPSDDYLDTCIRDRAFDIVANHYLGHPWPLYCDNTDVELFETNLKREIEKDD